MRTERLPSVSGQGSYRRLSPNIPDYSIEIPDDLFPELESSLFEVPAVRSRYSLQMSVEQPLFTGMRMTNSIRAAEHAAEASGFDAQAAESELRLRIRESYWRLYEALLVDQAVEAGIRSVEAHLADAENRFEEGMALRSDVLVMRARLSEIRVDKVDARGDVRVARVALNRQIGLPLDTEIVPSDSPDIRTGSIDLGSLVRTGKMRRSDLAALEERRRAAEDRARAARGGWFPAVSAVGTYYYARPNPYIFPQEDAFKGTWEAGFSATWDLWNWGRTASDVRRARYEADLAAELAEERSESVEMEITAAALALEHASAALAAADDAVAAAREAYRVVQDEHANGVALTSELLEAEAAFRDAQVARARNASALAVARATLARAAGVPEDDLP